MKERATPRTVRFLCQHCGEWCSYVKTAVGPTRYLCPDCRCERRKMLARYRYTQRTQASNTRLTKGT
jgi:hypothetical protein